MNNLLWNAVRYVLLSKILFVWLTAGCFGQISRIELTDFSQKVRGFPNSVSGAVVWKNTHAILAFESSLRRFSLVDGKEESIVYDLNRIPSITAEPGYACSLASSDSGSEFVLYSAGRDAKTGANCYLFDASAWSCQKAIEPIAKWYTEDLNSGVGPQILGEPGLIVVPRDLGRSCELEIRRTAPKAEVVQRVKLGGRYFASWWEKPDGLIVLCSKKPQPGRDYALSRFDLESGRIARTVDWQLPFEFGPYHRMNETATILQGSNGSAGPEQYLVQFGRPPRRLYNNNQQGQSHKLPSRNGRFLAGHQLPHSPRHYLLDLGNSREIAEFEAPNEWSLAISDDGRFYLTYLQRWENGFHQWKIVLRDFEHPQANDPSEG